GREILRSVRDMRAAAVGEALGGEIRLGAISTALTGLLPIYLKRFIAAAPLVDLYVVPGTSVELYRRVSDGDLDAAVMVRPQFALPKTSDWRTLRHEPLVLLTPRGMKQRDPHDILR